MKRIIIFSCLVITTSVYASGTPVVISLIHLLVFPDKFEGMNIRVSGYLQRDTGLKLYLTKEHADANDTPSSILLSDTNKGDISKSTCLSSFVTLEGKFFKSEVSSRHLIANINRVYKPSNNMICWGN